MADDTYFTFTYQPLDESEESGGEKEKRKKKKEIPFSYSYIENKYARL